VSKVKEEICDFKKSLDLGVRQERKKKPLGSSELFSNKLITITIHERGGPMKSLTCCWKMVLRGILILILSGNLTGMLMVHAEEPAQPKDEQAIEKGNTGEVVERAISGFGGGFGYTCETPIEGPKKCTCTNYVDCDRLKKGGDCCPGGKREGCAIVLTCELTGSPCTCTVSLKTPPTGFRLPMAPRSGAIMRRGIEGEQPAETAPEPSDNKGESGETTK